MESFFYEACKLDKNSAEELILRRYSDINYILRMPYDDFIGFYKLAKDKEKEERIFLQWALQLPLMTKDTYTSFEDYKDKLTGANIDTRTTQEMLDDITEIERQFEEKERGERYGTRNI